MKMDDSIFLLLGGALAVAVPWLIGVWTIIKWFT